MNKSVNAVGRGVFNSETPLSAILRQGDVCDLIGFEDQIHFEIVDIVDERVNVIDDEVGVIAKNVSLARATFIGYSQVKKIEDTTKLHTPYYWSFDGTPLIELVPDQSQIVVRDFVPVDRAERRAFNERHRHLPPAEQRRLFEEKFGVTP